MIDAEMKTDIREKEQGMTSQPRIVLVSAGRIRVVAALGGTMWLLTGLALAQCDFTAGTGKVTENCGSVGIGTTTPGLTLDVVGANTIRAIRTLSSGGGVAQAGLTLDAKLTTGQLVDGLGMAVVFQIEDSDTTAQTIGRIGAVRDGGDAIGKMVFRLGSSGGETDRLVISNAGVQAIGVPLTATYADLAEWVTVKGSSDPGTVVVVRKDARNEVVPSQSAYDTSVAGVVSSKPGIVLGEAGEGKATIATTGRVKVKVDASKAAVHTGDLLVTSDRAGFAMRSEPIEVSGISMHRPGTLIGKALEPLEGGEGEILVLLSLQ